jgi:hypothetical protein
MPFVDEAPAIGAAFTPFRDEVRFFRTFRTD